MLRLNKTCTSPRSLPKGKMFVPGSIPEEPFCPSMTTKNVPVCRMNTGRPCGSNAGVGVGVS